MFQKGLSIRIPDSLWVQVKQKQDLCVTDITVTSFCHMDWEIVGAFELC